LTTTGAGPRAEASGARRRLWTPQRAAASQLVEALLVVAHGAAGALSNRTSGLEGLAAEGARGRSSEWLGFDRELGHGLPAARREPRPALALGRLLGGSPVGRGSVDVLADLGVGAIPAGG